MNDSDPLVLPEVNQAILDRTTLDQLFSDLAACTRILNVQVKHGAEQYAPGSRQTLEEARRLLDQGRVRGVQIHYQYDGDTWCDTLIAVPGGTRIVRMKQLPVEPAAGKVA